RRTENGGRRTEGRERKTEDGGQRTEDGGRRVQYRGLVGRGGRRMGFSRWLVVVGERCGRRVEIIPSNRFRGAPGRLRFPDRRGCSRRLTRPGRPCPWGGRFRRGPIR